MVLEGRILLYYLKVFNFFLIIIITFLLLLFFLTISKDFKLNNNIINITKGQSIESVISSNFNNLNILESKLFKFYYFIYKKIFNKGIHYGDFSINQNISFASFLKIISKPSNILNKITIPEGLSKHELDLILNKHFKNIKSINYENILADTYYFQKNETFENFYKRLINFKNKYINKYINNSFFDNYSEKDLFIIGSIIEKEGYDDLDKSLISSVIFNRLKKNMKLQIDATVLYAITDGKYDLKRKLNYGDLKFKHSYNTYLNKGLPPGPISYVGTKTIDIIMEQKQTEFLFYFYNNSLKRHIFSKNYNNHKVKLNEYRNK